MELGESLPVITDGQIYSSVLPAQHVSQTDKSHVGQLKSSSVPRLEQLLTKVPSYALHLRDGTERTEGKKKVRHQYLPRSMINTLVINSSRTPGKQEGLSQECLRTDIAFPRPKSNPMYICSTENVCILLNHAGETW